MASKDAIAVIEPATEQVMAEVPRAGAEETDAAVERAKRAFPAWRAVDPAERSAILHRLANAIEERVGDLATLESKSSFHGRPVGVYGRLSAYTTRITKMIASVFTSL